MGRSREELLHGLTVDKSGVIRTHGKYFLERVFIPYFWERARAGEYDKVYTDRRNDKWYQFRVTSADRKQYPELGSLHIVLVRIQQHVVCSWLMTDQYLHPSEDLHQATENL